MASQIVVIPAKAWNDKHGCHNDFLRDHQTWSVELFCKILKES